MIAPGSNIFFSKQAFSLVELSVVIILIGLLASATMVGVDLLNTARLKSVISELEGYKIAIDNFQSQYNNLPGDMPNATSFWTTAQNGGTVAVVNGNGNGHIIGVDGSGNDLTGTTANTNYTEPYYVWNHLTLAKFIPGTFTGSSSSGATPGTNVPASKYLTSTTAGYSLRYILNPFSYSDSLGRSIAANYLNLGTNSGTNNYFAGGAFNSVDAYYIDSKSDDGSPDSGNIISGNAACISGSSPSATYNLSNNSSTSCPIFLNIDQ